MLLLLLLFALVCFLHSDAENDCRTVAQFLQTDTNTTASKQRDFEKVELFFSNSDDFTITERLGSGSYGEAYLGHNITSLQPYVFKLYRFGKLKRKKMMREIFVTQSVCGHPNIIKLFHVIKQTLTGYPILVFEYARSTSYKDLLPLLKPEDVRYYMYETFKGLAFAHERGVMHKDLKPSNIMIDHPTRTLKIIDWGLSQFYVQDESQSIAGSMYYKSPEMLLDYGRSELSTDIWSLGCVFAALLFKKHVFFEGDSNFDQLVTISKVLGTRGLLELNAKYGMELNVSAIPEELPRRPWESLITPQNTAFATPQALHLLDHMLVYDHRLRISCRDALHHPYFRPLRARVAADKSTASSGADGDGVNMFASAVPIIIDMRAVGNRALEATRIGGNTAHTPAQPAQSENPVPPAVPVPQHDDHRTKAHWDATAKALQQTATPLSVASPKLRGAST